MSDVPAVTGVVVSRLGMMGSWVFWDLDQRADGFVWQVASKVELPIGARVAVFGHVPAEAVVYADRFDVLEPVQ